MRSSEKWGGFPTCLPLIRHEQLAQVKYTRWWSSAALQKAAGPDWLASTWYATTSFTIDVQITDGNTHQVGLYCLDWDGGRAEVIDVLDGVSGAVPR